MLKIITLSLSRLPRLALFLLIALIFGVSIETDTFFLIYGFATFFASISVFSSEIMAPTRSMLIGSIAVGIVVMGVLAFVIDMLALTFIPMLIVISISGTLTGVAYRRGEYTRVIISSISYLPAVWIIWIYQEPQIIILAITSAELARVFLLSKYFEGIMSEDDFGGTVKALAPAVLPGLVGLTDKLLAGTLEGGDITKITYAEGVSSLLGSLLTYGLIVVRLNGETKDKDRVFSWTGFLTFGFILAYLLVALKGFNFGPWTGEGLRELAPIIAAMSLVVPIRAVAATIYPGLVLQKQFGDLTFVTIIMVIINLAFSFFLMKSFGVVGIAMGTVVAALWYTGGVWFVERSNRERAEDPPVVGSSDLN